MDKSEIKITKNDVLKGISGRTYLDDITFAPASKIGHTFGGWYKDSACTNA